MIDQEKIRQAVSLFLEGIGEDTEREGLAETPDRVARMCTEIFSGMEEDPGQHLEKRFHGTESDMVIQRDIIFYSVCEHHLLPFFGKAHIAYIPNGEVVGLSKLARTVEVFARRPQLQERLTAQIADAIMEHLAPKGVMVMLEAEHTCISMRGVKKAGTQTVTCTKRGVFLEDPALSGAFLDMLGKR